VLLRELLLVAFRGLTGDRLAKAVPRRIDSQMPEAPDAVNSDDVVRGPSSVLAQ